MADKIYISGSPSIGDTVWILWLAASFSRLHCQVLCPTTPEFRFLFSGEPAVNADLPLFSFAEERDFDIALVLGSDVKRVANAAKIFPLPSLRMYVEPGPGQKGLENEQHYLEETAQLVRQVLPEFVLSAPRMAAPPGAAEGVLSGDWLQRSFVCISTGASYDFKHYPPAAWQQLVELLNGAGCAAVVLSGPKDQPVPVPNGCSSRILDLQGKLTLAVTTLSPQAALGR